MEVKIYHATPWYNYSSWIKGVKIAHTVEEADVVMFCGGTDFFAGRYGEKQHPAAERPDHARDERESALFKQAVALNKKIIGICRGSQLVCALNHGRLVQHQPNPAYIHPIKTYDGKEIMITSTHHQAQFPFNLKPEVDFKLLGWTKGLLKFHEDGEEKEMNPPYEAEVVYYPKTKALAIQGHPEMMRRSERPETFEWLDKQIELLLTDKL